MSIRVDKISRTFGDTVALSQVSFTVGPGITGLLGHNGAGKSTLLSLLAGYSSPDEGSVRILDGDPRTDRALHRRIGVVPDGQGLWSHLTAREAVTALAKLRDVPDPAAAAAAALDEVGLTDAADRRLGQYSKGMGQRAKLAQALVHDPDVLLLDEPLNGLDPAQRRHMIDVVSNRAANGCTVLVSSHVLHEVERMAPQVVVLVNGRVVAEGETVGIKALLRDRPQTVRVTLAGDPRPLASALAGVVSTQAIRVSEHRVEVDTLDPEALGLALSRAAAASGTTLRSIEPVGDDLESLYAYLTARARGAAR
jgi:ABC-2 type transport system ATP-binding protein